MQPYKELGLLGPDPKDIRDYQLLAIQPDKVELPDEYCLIPKMTSIQCQNWGTCTSHAVDGVKEFLDKLEYQKEIKLSQKFIYYNTKKISNYYFTEGDSLRNALKAVCKYGACKEETFLDVPEKNWQEYIAKEPPFSAYQEAIEFQAKSYWSVPVTLENLKQACFKNQRPLIMGMEWYLSYYDILADGKLPLPKKVCGGHALIYVGWTKGKQWFRNSFGKDWGYNGYFYIPDEEWSKHKFFPNAWILLDYSYSVMVKILGTLRQLIALYQQLIEKVAKK